MGSYYYTFVFKLECLWRMAQYLNGKYKMAAISIIILDVFSLAIWIPNYSSTIQLMAHSSRSGYDYSWVIATTIIIVCNNWLYEIYLTIVTPCWFFSNSAAFSRLEHLLPLPVCTGIQELAWIHSSRGRYLGVHNWLRLSRVECKLPDFSPGLQTVDFLDSLTLIVLGVISAFESLWLRLLLWWLAEFEWLARFGDSDVDRDRLFEFC